MRRDARALLWDVQNAATKIQQFLRDSTHDQFIHDELLQSAVERQLEIVGEALSQLARTAPALAEQVPDLRQMVGLRNILIHGYVAVDVELVWRAVQDNLPGLKATADRLLSPNQPPA